MDNRIIIVVSIIILIVIGFDVITQKNELKEEIQNLTNINELNSILLKSQNQTINSKNNEIDYYNQTLNEQNKLTQYYIDESKYYAGLDNKLDMTPRWSDVKSFLKNNMIDKYQWSEHSYDCTAFSNDLIKEALNNNLFMCTVEIDWRNSGHMIVAVNTSDKGLIYIEPQTDNIIDLHLGKDGHSGFPGYFVISYDSCFERIMGEKE